MEDGVEVVGAEKALIDPTGLASKLYGAWKGTGGIRTKMENVGGLKDNSGCWLTFQRRKRNLYFLHT